MRSAFIAVVNDGITRHLYVFTDKIEVRESSYEKNSDYTVARLYDRFGTYGTHLTRHVCQVYLPVGLYASIFENIRGPNGN